MLMSMKLIAQPWYVLYNIADLSCKCSKQKSKYILYSCIYDHFWNSDITGTHLKKFQ